jgi:hypothetical protein
MKHKDLAKEDNLQELIKTVMKKHMDVLPEDFGRNEHIL